MHRIARPWPVLPLLLLLPVVVGCDITPEPEEIFQVQGVLSQATADTTTTDHFGPAVSPDGTRILFITDAYAEDKDSAANDYVLVDLPGPGVFPKLVENVGENPGWTRINMRQIPNDQGTLFPGIDAAKGEVAWLDDSNQFVAVITNDAGNSRLYRFTLGVRDQFGQIPVENPRLIDDVDFANVGNRRAYRYSSPAVSPDGQWVAYSRFYYRAGDDVAGIPTDAEYMAVYAYNLNSGEVVRVTNGSTLEKDPSWSPDGSQIVFTAQAGEVGTRDLMKVDFDPSRSVELREWIPWEEGGQTAPFTDGRVRLTSTSGVTDWKLPAGSFEPTWLRDGRIVFTSTRRAPGASVRVRNLWMIGPDGGEPSLVFFSYVDDAQANTANFQTATSDAASLIVFSTRINRSEDFVDQKQDIWVLRRF